MLNKRSDNNNCCREPRSFRELQIVVAIGNPEKQDRKAELPIEVSSEPRTPHANTKGLGNANQCFEKKEFSEANLKTIAKSNNSTASNLETINRESVKSGDFDATRTNRSHWLALGFYLKKKRRERDSETLNH